MGKQQVVPDYSSAFGRRDIETIAYVNKNHMDMCKFASVNDPAYGDFKANLTRYLQILATNKLQKSGTALQGESSGQTGV